MATKRKFRYRVQCERKRISAMFSSRTDNQIIDEINIVSNNIENNEERIFGVNPPKIFNEKLKEWFLNSNVSVKSATNLLKILQSENISCPSSVSGLLKIKNNCITRTVAPGSYVHIGLKVQLNKIKRYITSLNLNKIIIDVGVDGLPLFKSSNIGLWPIMADIVNVPNLEVFLIGSYVGPSKPSSVNNFLHDFISEAKSLQDEGFLIDGIKIEVEFRAFICDAPARSFLCGIKGHNSLNGCSKCYQVGTSVDNVTTFNTVSGSMRTHDDFINRTDEQFHLPICLNMKLDLEDILVNMVKQFPLDPMHLIDLGVSKKMLQFIIKRKTNFKLSNNKITESSSLLLSLAPYIPTEFCRKPRSFEDLGRWKAVEFKNFVLYWGIIFFKKYTPHNIFQHFLYLHIAYRLLFHVQTSDVTTIATAKFFIEQFVVEFPDIYGVTSVTYNVHNMLHLTDCVEYLGSLNNFSAYKFENALQKIKRTIKMPKHIPQQLYHRHSILNLAIENEMESLKRCDGAITSISKSGLKFSIKFPDNVCQIDTKEAVVILNFENEQDFIGKQFINKRPFFETPMSSTDLGIFLVENSYGPQKKYKTNNIIGKFMCLPINNNFLLVPLLHKI